MYFQGNRLRRTKLCEIFRSWGKFLHDERHYCSRERGLRETFLLSTLCGHNGNRSSINQKFGGHPDMQSSSVSILDFPTSGLWEISFCFLKGIHYNILLLQYVWTRKTVTSIVIQPFLAECRKFSLLSSVWPIEHCQFKKLGAANIAVGLANKTCQKSILFRTERVWTLTCVEM